MSIGDATQIMLLLVMIATAVIAIRAKDLLKAVIALAGFSLALSVEFFMLHAPDVAIAEAAIGAGLTTAIYIFTIRATRRMETENNED